LARGVDLHRHIPWDFITRQSQHVGIRIEMGLSAGQCHLEWLLLAAGLLQLDDLNEAVRLDPNSPNGYVYRAWLWSTCPDNRFRDGQKAVEDAKRVCEMLRENDPSYRDALEALAAAYAETGDFDAAVEHQTKVVNETRGFDNSEQRSRLKLYTDRKAYREELLK
jgi:hypothetical protein